VDEVLFSLDPSTDPAGAAGLDALLAELCAGHPGARVAPVDAGEAALARVSQAFFGGARVPSKDTKGAPFYPYFHGLVEARNDHVLHLDSDMLFGGGSQTWMAEALALLASRPEVLFCGPMPGPPRPDGWIDQDAERDDGPPPGFRFPTMSTRIFLVDRRALSERLGPLDLEHPVKLHRRVKAVAKGRPPAVAAEIVVSAAMVERGLHRVDFLGADPGMWSLHPLYRSPEFYEALPELVARVERGDVPEDQLGRYDVQDSLFDFTRARRRAARRRLWA
jgi:hypothetical protein